MKWKTAIDAKTEKQVHGAAVSECGAYHLCAALVMGNKHYMAWHNKEIIAGGYDKKAVLDAVNEHAAKQEKPVKKLTPPVNADWFTEESGAQVE